MPSRQVDDCKLEDNNALIHNTANTTFQDTHRPPPQQSTAMNHENDHLSIWKILILGGSL